MTASVRRAGLPSIWRPELPYRSPRLLRPRSGPGSFRALGRTVRKPSHERERRDQRQHLDEDEPHPDPPHPMTERLVEEDRHHPVDDAVSVDEVVVRPLAAGHRVDVLEREPLVGVIRSERRRLEEIAAPEPERYCQEPAEPAARSAGGSYWPCDRGSGRLGRAASDLQV